MDDQWRHQQQHRHDDDISKTSFASFVISVDAATFLYSHLVVLVALVVLVDILLVRMQIQFKNELLMLSTSSMSKVFYPRRASGCSG